MIKKQFGGYYDINDGKISGAGVILVTYIGDQIPSIVLIHAKSKNAFEEPGGGSHGHTKTQDYGNIVDTARRELFEETAGLIDARSIDLYGYYMDTHVRKNKRSADKWFYRTYFMHVNGITRKHFHYNYKILSNPRNKTPKEYLESDELIVVPLSCFRKIQKIGTQFAISIGDQLIPISKRLKRIMTSGGIELAAKILLETKPKIATQQWIEHKKGFLKGMFTLVI